MAYYLDKIADYLEAQGYTNIFVDYYIEAGSDTSTDPSIILMAEGGSKTVNIPYNVFDFAIYVRRANKLEARETAQALFELLDSRGDIGDPVLRLKTRQSPYFYSTTGNTMTTYIITMTANSYSPTREVR